MSNLSKNTGLRIIVDGKSKNLFAVLIKQEYHNILKIELSESIKGKMITGNKMILKPFDRTETFVDLKNYSTVKINGFLTDEYNNEEQLFTGSVTID